MSSLLKNVLTLLECSRMQILVLCSKYTDTHIYCNTATYRSFALTVVDKDIQINV